MSFASTKTERRRGASIAALCALLPLCFGDAIGAPQPHRAATARAAQTKKQAPLVARPAPKPAPAQPATIAPPVEPSAPILPEQPPPDTRTPPPMLPRASRARMHACAVAWERRKMDPHGPLPLWRDYAAQCLTR